MDGLTTRQSMLLYLRSYTGIRDYWGGEAPFAITQDGIAGAMGITRGHACLLLGRMASSGLVYSEVSHIADHRKKRLVYRLTPAGTEEADTLMKIVYPRGRRDLGTMLRNGLDGCSSAESLTQEDRDGMGWLCVIRREVLWNEVPPDKPNLARFGGGGRIALREETKGMFVDSATEEELKHWHSEAADWFSRYHPDDPERLEHLALAGLTTECRLKV